MPTVDPNFMAVVQSLKPYMSKRILNATEIAETLIDMLETDQAKQIQEKMKSLIIEAQGMNQTMVMQDKKLEAESGSNPFTLFLILILLILSDLGSDGGIFGGLFKNK
ncbi:MAG: hypothetical protein PWP31_448 [Clostridia bacterium]|nr:hypothetical protein [Clostridia bacterium]